MKHYLAPILLAIGVAATPSISFCEEGVEPPYGYYDPGDGGQPIGLYTIEQFQAAMQQAKASVDKIASAAAKQKEQINTLWQEASQLVDGLKEDIGKLEKLVELSDSENGFVTTDALNEWINGEYADKISEIEESLKTKKDKDDDDDPEDLSDYAKKSDLTDYAKKSDLNDYAKESELSDYAKKTELNDYAKKSDLSDYLKTSDAQSTYATKETTNNHETRITALENRPGGGGGCDDNCRESWQSVFDFFGEDVATIDEAQGTGSCHRVTFSGTALDWLKSFPIAYVGSDFSYGSEAQQMWDDEGKPTFVASPDWAGDGLAEEDGVLKVSVGNSASGSLGGALDGTETTDAESVVAVDGNGNLCKLGIGSISPGNPDGETIEAKDDGEGGLVLGVISSGICDGDTIEADGDNLLKVNTENIVDGNSIEANEGGNLALKRDGDTIAVSAAGAKVDASKLCDNSTIKTDGNGKLYFAATVVTNTLSAGAGIKLTQNGGGHITISVEDLEDEDGDDTEQVVTVVTDVQYDISTHKFQCKRRTLTFKGHLGDAGEWEDVFEATSHKGEHTDE